MRGHTVDSWICKGTASLLQLIQRRWAFSSARAWQLLWDSFHSPPGARGDCPWPLHCCGCRAPVLLWAWMKTNSRTVQNSMWLHRHVRVSCHILNGLFQESLPQERNWEPTRCLPNHSSVKKINKSTALPLGSCPVINFNLSDASECAWASAC